MIPSDSVREFSSFRDPSGCVFTRQGVLYRQINPSYFQQYRSLMDSGLYGELRKFDAIVAHEEIEAREDAVLIRPARVPFISYPYEWSFGELRDAALLTLKLHRRALRHDMILKDASAYNIQFISGSPVLIDTLSFDFYQEGEPWGAYGQFCRHFLAPLLLMREKDVRLNRMLSLFIDGIPLDLAASLLGGKGGLLAKEHIVWHANSVSKHNEDGRKRLLGGKGQKSAHLTKEKQLAIIESLIRGFEGMALVGVETEWGDYYAHTNYSPEAGEEKGRLVSMYLDKLHPSTVWDLGANDGTYSKLALEAGAHVVAFDIDPVAVERNYNEVKKARTAMLPLVLDLTNPSPGIGFTNCERTQINARQTPDCVMALAVIHHLAISNNLPLTMLAQWFASLSRNLIIEFVPKEDSQVQVLLATRTDIFPDYTQQGFEEAFGQYFTLREKASIQGSVRTLYLWEREVGAE